MSPDAARLTIGLALVPLCLGLTLFTVVTLEFLDIGGNTDWRFLIALEVVTLTALLTWLLAWRGRVRWTRPRIWMTALLAGVALVAPIAGLPYPASSHLQTLGDMTILLGLSIWMIGTALVWRDNKSAARSAGPISQDELQSAIRCPTCDYPLIGLRQVVCPECGWTATVDEVVRRAIDQITETQGV